MSIFALSATFPDLSNPQRSSSSESYVQSALLLLKALVPVST